MGPQAANSASISLIQPVDLYSRVDRATKYGFLFIGFTFLALLMFDIIGGVRVSAVEYLLMGAAIVLFFVLLLAFAEVIGFTAAYVVASAAIAGLNTAYSAAVLGSWKRGYVIGGLLIGLYAVLYILLGLEAFSLLIGSVLLFVALAGVMYATRRIDWSGTAKEARSLGAGRGERLRLRPLPDDRPKTAKTHFPEASTDARAAKHVPSSPQTESEAYKLAFQDNDFLLRPDLRPVRFQLELLKPELLMNEANIASTFVFYGSARVPEPAKAQALLEAARTDWDSKVAERLIAKSHYYDEARKLARSGQPVPGATRTASATSSSARAAGRRSWRPRTAARRTSAWNSIGLNIVLPHEQLPNIYVTPDLSFQFHYFALRKMHFLLRARAVAVFPGGYGTFDEMFELLTLIQTGKVRPLPILLFGREFWERVVDFHGLAEEGVISPHDLDLITWVETAEEAWDAVCAHYEVC